jgi:hypothetical protein
MKKDQPVRGAKKLPTFVSRAERAQGPDKRAQCDQQ